MKAILFDLDGTLGGYGLGNGQYLQKKWRWLVERYPASDFGDAKTFLNTYRQLNASCWGAWVKKELLLDREQVKVYIFEQLLKHFGVDDAQVQTLAIELQQGLVAEYPEEWRPTQGIADVLAWARGTGAVLGLFSNGHVEEQTGKLRDHGLLDAFDHLFFSAEVGFAKPDVRMFEHALQVCGCRPEEALMIGDSYTHDLAPAEQLGMSRIWVYEDAPILGLPDDRSVADVREIPQKFASLSSR